VGFEVPRPTAFLALSRSDCCRGCQCHEPEIITKDTHVVVVRVAREGVTDLLGGRLLALGLKSRGSRVGVALELVTEVLGGRLLRVGLKGGGGLVGQALTADWRQLSVLNRRWSSERRHTVRHDIKKWVVEEVEKVVRVVW
jgi:hypothetical protein